MPALLTPILSLGDFDFVGAEEPESVTFGKEQASYTHILIGGGHVVDLLGAGDPDISWSGYFTGIQAQFRAQYLENLCKQGQSLNLVTSTFVKQVVITRFTYGFHFIYPIRYTITLKVIQDLTLPVNYIIPPDITISVTSALIQAQDLAIQVGNLDVMNAIALTLTAIQNASPLTSAPNTAINASLIAAQNAQTAVSQAIAGAEAKIFTQ